MTLSLTFGCSAVPQKTALRPGQVQEVSPPRQEAPLLKAELENRFLEGLSSPESARLMERAHPSRPPSVEIDLRVAQEMEELERRTTLPITFNAQVRRWIDIFQTRYHERFRLWLSRSGRYIPMMRQILREHGLPDDLVYLAMIESGFSCHARSRAAAVGPWQFIAGTGRHYGLKINSWVDERKDPVKSTKAAARYLRDLYEEFGAWYLACAGYNAGEGKIRRALRYHKADNFWDIAHPAKRRSYIKRETRNYIPKMIAAAIIAKDPASYGFKRVEYQAPLAYETARVTIPVDLRLVARELKVSYRSLKDLNPELKLPSTPQNGQPYDLRLPKGSSLDFLNRQVAFKAKPIRTFITHRLRPGENPSTVAKKYRISVGNLLAHNKIRDPRRLKVGQKLRIPVRTYAYADIDPRTGRKKTASAKAGRSKTGKGSLRSQRSRSRTHVVRSGESAWSISRRYRVTLKAVQRANNIHGRSKLRVGQVLIIPGPAKSPSPRAGARPPARKEPQSLVHVVKSGESVWIISRKYQIDHKKLMAWNNITNHRRLKIGQKLTVYLDEAS